MEDIIHVLRSLKEILLEAEGKLETLLLRDNSTFISCLQEAHATEDLKLLGKWLRRAQQSRDTVEVKVRQRYNLEDEEDEAIFKLLLNSKEEEEGDEEEEEVDIKPLLPYPPVSEDALNSIASRLGEDDQSDWVGGEDPHEPEVEEGETSKKEDPNALLQNHDSRVTEVIPKKRRRKISAVPPPSDPSPTCGKRQKAQKGRQGKHPVSQQTGSDCSQVVVCPICTQSVALDEFEAHSISNHGCSLAELKSNYPDANCSSIPMQCDKCTKWFASLVSHVCGSTAKRKRKTQDNQDGESNSNLNEGYRSRRRRPRNDQESDLEATVTCDVCQRTVRSSYLSTHKRLCHTHTGEKFPCPQCSKVFPKPASLARHIKTHSEVKEHVCPICAHAYHEKRNLTAHMAKHSEERPIKCEKCEATFRFPQSLRTHIEAKHDGTPNQCAKCGKMYNTKRNLERHVRCVHEKVRRYPCPVPLCDKAFTRNRHLKYHIKTHSNPNTKYRGLNKDKG